MVAEGRFAPLPSLVLFWRSLDREVPVDSILNINNMASGLHIFHLGFFLIPLIFPILYAGVVELADTPDSKSDGEYPCRFESGPGHHFELLDQVFRAWSFFMI